MLAVETVVRVRREHIGGKAIKAIARDLHLSRKVVRKAICAPRALSTITERFNRFRGSGLSRSVWMRCWPGPSMKRTGRPSASTTAWLLVPNPPLERPRARASWPPFLAALPPLGPVPG